MQAKELSTNEAYADWKLRLAAEPLEKAKQELEKIYYDWWEYFGNSAIEAAFDEWTRKCIEWYDEYLSVCEDNNSDMR